uniref:Uncharacterized protein n=1 Tax=Rousettus aegyptiacus TaxID=9407 RepID=A0A7J8DI75_ROUAE|nr:hypothetical protein HJG63_008545 [Rousettus aegyptiacus]
MSSIALKNAHPRPRSLTPSPPVQGRRDGRDSTRLPPPAALQMHAGWRRKHPCELWVGFMSIHRRGHWSPEKFSNWPKVPRPSSSSSRMQTQDQSCPYNLSTVGESARKSSGLGFQGKAAIRIWFLLAKQISMSALGHSLCTDPCICLLRHPLSSC